MYTVDRQLDRLIHIINIIYWTERLCKFLIFSVQSKEQGAGRLSGKIFLYHCGALQPAIAIATLLRDAERL